MGNLFSIGEMAKLFNINIRTLRYYDSIGLLKPEYVDKSSNYRYYGTKQFEKLNTIKYLRALDMPIEKIITFFEHKDVNVMLDMFEEQLKKVQEKKHELDLIERKINNRIFQLRSAVSSPLEKIETKKYPERHIAILKKSIQLGDDLEYPIRKLERIHNLDSSVFLGKIGVSVEKDSILSENYGTFSSVFLFAEDEDKSCHNIVALPECQYAQIRFCGTHTDSPKYYKKLLEYLKMINAYICGDALEVTIIDSGITNNESQFVTEIQMPYKKY
ncbi:MerR family transcriptional regulator [Lachnospiraceae bacterium NSJ-143]|nr:MerR family transcriptional regulator [Lachnospiraceae bacterium NSJ-143]